MNSGYNEPKFGELAITLGYIRSDDLKQALAMQKVGERWGVGFLLVRLNKLTLEQVEEILNYQDVNFINVDEEIAQDSNEQHRLGEIAVSSRAINYSDLLHALEQKSRMKEIDGTEPKLGKVLVDLNLITEDQLKLMLSKGGINVYQCQRCNRIYNVKKFAARDFCCPFCHYREQIKYDADILNIEGRLQIGHLESKKSSRKITQVFKKSKTAKFLLEHNLGKISHYDIIEEVGIGRMGVVSKVREQRTGKIYALKAFIVDSELKENTLNYFEKHYVRYQQLTHPNIAKLIEFDKFDNLLYAVFEFTEGIPIDLWIIREGGDIKKKLELIIELSKTLAFAHENGVYHLNLHPGNIFVDKHGKIKITDFAMPSPLSESTSDYPIFGMRKYLTPENFSLDLESLESKTDQFALGCLAYEIITSNAPFVATSLHETSKLLSKGLPEAIETKYLTPFRDFENVIQKCLESKLAARYSNLFEMAEDGIAVLRGEKIVATPISSWRRFYQKYGNYVKLMIFPILAVIAFLSVQVFIVNQPVNDKPSNNAVTVDEQEKLLEAAKKAFEQEKYSEVSKILKEMDAETCAEPEVLNLALKLAEIADNNEQILRIYKTKEFLSSNIENLLIFTDAAISSGDYALASQIMLDSFETHKTNSKIYPVLMELLRKLENWDKLLEVGEYAISMLDVRDDYFAYCCLAAGKLKKWNKSKTYFMQAVANSTNKALAYHFPALANIDRLGTSVKSNIRILDTVLRDARKAQSLNPRIPGNAYFIERVNREYAKIKYQHLKIDSDKFARKVENILIDAADLLVQQREYDNAQVLMAEVNFENLSSQKLFIAAQSFYQCGNYQKVLDLLKGIEKKQNLHLTEYLLLVKTLNTLEEYVNAYLYCQRAMKKYPDNFELMFEFARSIIEISGQNVPDEIIAKFRTNTLYQAKYHFLQAQNFRTKQNKASERKSFMKVLETANSLNDKEIYESSVLRLLEISLQNLDFHIKNFADANIKKATEQITSEFIDYLRYYPDSGMLFARVMKEMLRSGYADIAQYFHRIAAVEIEGVSEFEDEISVLTKIYTFEHNEIAAMLSKKQVKTGLIVTYDDISYVAELSGKPELKAALFDYVSAGLESLDSNKLLRLKNLNKFIVNSTISPDVLVAQMSDEINEQKVLKKLIENPRNPADYFTFIKSWGGDKTIEKLESLLDDGHVFECLNYISRHSSDKPKEQHVDLRMKVFGYLSRTAEIQELLALYKDRFLKNPKRSSIIDALIAAIRERNKESFNRLLLQYKKMLLPDEISVLKRLNDFNIGASDKQAIFNQLQNIIVAKTGNGDIESHNIQKPENSRVFRIFVMLAIKNGFINNLHPAILQLASTVEGLDVEFLSLMRNIEQGFLQNLRSESIEFEEYSKNSRNSLIISAIDSMLKGYGIVSDLQIDRVSSSAINDKTVLYFKMLTGEPAHDSSDFMLSDSENRINFFTKIISDSLNEFLPVSDDFLLTLYPETIGRILQLVKADKQICNEKLEEAQAILDSVEDTGILSDIILYLKKKMYFFKNEYKISAQIRTKQNYADSLRLQLLSELQSGNDKMFSEGFERLIADDSIDSNLLFDAANVLYSVPTKIDLSQINNIFKTRETLAGSDPILKLARAIMLKSIARDEKSDAIFTELLRFHPRNSKIYHTATQIAINENDFEKASDIIAKAKENEVFDNELMQLEILILLLREKYTDALQITLSLIASENDFNRRTIVQYLQFLTTKFPLATQMVILQQALKLQPENTQTNELMLINAFKQDDIEQLYVIAERLYMSSAQKSRFAKWIVWTLCRKEQHIDALKIVEKYRPLKDPWFNGAEKYCELGTVDFKLENVEITLKYLSGIPKKPDNAEELLWGSLIAHKIGELEIAKTLRTAGSDMIPDNLSGIYNLVIDRVNSGRFNDAVTLLSREDRKFEDWMPFALLKLMVAGNTSNRMSEIPGLKRILRETGNYKLLHMALWLVQDIESSMLDLQWLDSNIADENIDKYCETSDKKAEILAMRGILAFRSGKFRQSERFWRKSANTSPKFEYLKNYANTITSAFEQKK
ncbi:MAG: serine/threonine protein kinase [Planctomycetes bacterium]|nr:serine/threonine protein kinase [Planctomycetota bacterium]